MLFANPVADHRINSILSAYSRLAFLNPNLGDMLRGVRLLAVLSVLAAGKMLAGC